ncbi:MAG: cupredoxin domain-containing protein [Candidatus Sungbacteria bacterium]|nr:cupredoxin domain-containing protein [Candidatus Sungbacteria bacterium]
MDRDGLMNSENTPKPAPLESLQPAPNSALAPKTVKEFNVGGSKFKFSVNEIRVKKGDTVKIIFTSMDTKHDWRVDEFGAGSSVLDAGQSQTVEFTADKAGSFEYYCSVMQHRQMGMKGTLIVEE